MPSRGKCRAKAKYDDDPQYETKWKDPAGRKRRRTNSDDLNSDEEWNPIPPTRRSARIMRAASEDKKAVKDYVPGDRNSTPNKAKDNRRSSAVRKARNCEDESGSAQEDIKPDISEIRLLQSLGWSDVRRKKDESDSEEEVIKPIINKVKKSRRSSTAKKKKKAAPASAKNLGDQDGRFEVEHILDVELRDGMIYYKVKWACYPHADNSWEREEDLFCDERIADFEYYRKVTGLPVAVDLVNAKMQQVAEEVAARELGAQKHAIPLERYDEERDGEPAIAEETVAEEVHRIEPNPYKPKKRVILDDTDSDENLPPKARRQATRRASSEPTNPARDPNFGEELDDFVNAMEHQLQQRPPPATQPAQGQLISFMKYMEDLDETQRGQVFSRPDADYQSDLSEDPSKHETWDIDQNTAGDEEANGRQLTEPRDDVEQGREDLTLEDLDEATPEGIEAANQLLQEQANNPENPPSAAQKKTKARPVSAESSGNQDEKFEVERILNVQMKDGVILYLVKWAGCPEEDITWERAENIVCDDLIEDFNVRRKAARQPTAADLVMIRMKRQAEKFAARERAAQSRRLSTVTKKKKMKATPSKNPVEQDGKFEVERILDVKLKDGGISYLVKWAGYPDQDNSWEVKEHLFCDERIAEFEYYRQFAGLPVAKDLLKKADLLKQGAEKVAVKEKVAQRAVYEDEETMSDYVPEERNSITNKDKGNGRSWAVRKTKNRFEDERDYEDQDIKSDISEIRLAAETANPAPNPQFGYNRDDVVDVMDHQQQQPPAAQPAELPPHLLQELAERLMNQRLFRQDADDLSDISIQDSIDLARNPFDDGDLSSEEPSEHVEQWQMGRDEDADGGQQNGRDDGERDDITIEQLIDGVTPEEIEKADELINELPLSPEGAVVIRSFSTDPNDPVSYIVLREGSGNMEIYSNERSHAEIPQAVLAFHERTYGIKHRI